MRCNHASGARVMRKQVRPAGGSTWVMHYYSIKTAHLSGRESCSLPNKWGVLIHLILEQKARFVCFPAYLRRRNTLDLSENTR